MDSLTIAKKPKESQSKPELLISNLNSQSKTREPKKQHINDDGKGKSFFLGL